MLDSVLTKDHERIDAYFNDFLLSLSSKPDVDKLDLIVSSLRNHMFWEEEYLFPEIFEENRLRIQGLEAEHGAILKLLEEVKKLISVNEIEDAKKKTQGVMRVLKGHNEAEEGYIYLELDKLESKKQAGLILKEVEHASAPKGWTCRVLRAGSLK
ncbi:MAG: hemerythrin domain-containing protein [Candidatus Parvarchaeota archaeon]|nr:hemerythrin domain-containing protein [Candidatus Parvarchaeota archaeon]MCL5107159.1 hemerythrin domain-containing protein [Candidatus Parvarchaeota archaeon]